MSSPAAGTPASSAQALITGEKAKRADLIRKIEAERGSRVIAYVTDPRQGALGTSMADDVVPLFHDHLRVIGRSPRIDVFMYTHGGHAMTPNTLVHLLREFCDELGVLVPHRAMSAGTTLALGANQIVMGPLASLGPTDPSVSNAFNPVVEDAEGNKKREEISVEDVSGYLALARDIAGITPGDMPAVMDALSSRVHPLALGNVHRQYQLIRTMSRRLLGLHMDAATDKDKIDAIVDMLTEKLYFHGYHISRHEADKVIGLPVVAPDPPLESAMWELYECYRAALQLDGFSPTGSFVLHSAVLESTAKTHAFEFTATATPRTGGKSGVQIDVQGSRWKSV